MRGDASLSGLYGLGVIGALVYFIQQSQGFWSGFLGVLKAFIWPAILIYRLFLALP
ncbi:hypothetical protein JW933_01745 [candidate division FCPU426 bacterium]|nr:hypothetical protein [candidate division FCPU426 bacterium]